MFIKRLSALLCCVAVSASLLAGCKEVDVNKYDGAVAPETTQATVMTVPSVTASKPLSDVTSSAETEGLTEAPAVDTSYFDDTVFIGDSVSLKLCYYAMSTKKLGKAQFLTAGSLGVNNALWEISDESVHPSYKGEKMLLEDGVEAIGAKKVYMMLGMNDLALYGIEDTVNNYKVLADKILEKSPEAEIYIQSMTPMTETSNILSDDLNNEVIKEYNSELKSLCEKEGWTFIDVASVMYDDEGVSLKTDFCSDPEGMGVHFTETGCDVWIDYLYAHKG